MNNFIQKHTSLDRVIPYATLVIGVSTIFLIWNIFDSLYINAASTIISLISVALAIITLLIAQSVRYYVIQDVLYENISDIYKNISSLDFSISLSESKRKLFKKYIILTRNFNLGTFKSEIESILSDMEKDLLQEDITAEPFAASFRSIKKLLEKSKRNG